MRRVADTKIEACDPGLGELVDLNAPLWLIDDSSQHCEGPVYLPDSDSVVWSDVSGDRVLEYRQGTVSVIRSPSHYQNGNALDLEGRIVACSHGDRAIVRHEKDGEWHILIDRYGSSSSSGKQGQRLNSPNDIIVKSDGTLWFTDPPFGLTEPGQGSGGEQELAGSFVFRFVPETGELAAVIKEMDRPNGLAFNRDESLLYVSDTAAVINPHLHHDIRVYDVAEDGSVKNGRLFISISPGQPDGFCLDWQDNLFVSSEDSIQIFNAQGKKLGKIMLPEICANLTFGGPHWNQLFIAAGGSLLMMELKTHRLPSIPK